MLPRFIDMVLDRGIEYKLNTMVMDISADKKVTAMNREDGMFEVQAKLSFSLWAAANDPEVP